MNEAETRAEHIDPALKAAGWGVVEGSRIRREYVITLGRLEGSGRRGKPLIADYVPEYRNTKLAVVEAKAWDEALTEGVAQAKDYAGKMAIRHTYASNGRGIYAIDMQNLALLLVHRLGFEQHGLRLDNAAESTQRVASWACSMARGSQSA